MKVLSNKSLIVLFVLLLIGISGVFYFRFKKPYTFEITVEKKIENKILNKRHPLSGKRCINNNRRPFAVMLSEDTITRPLSGIAKADIVVEMPVVKDSITRIMAFYACEEPKEIGSVRSARRSFIPLAAAFDAIYAHWGGSSFALRDLSTGIIDNVDALINPNNVYFRKDTIYAPHNGFTTYERMFETSKLLNYRLETNFESYPLENENVPGEEQDIPTTISIGYPKPFNVSYIYSKEKNEYLRWRDSRPEIDALDNSQVTVKVLIVMKTNTRRINADYNEVDVVGEGEAIIFQNGGMQRVKWKKDAESPKSRLIFVDGEDNEIPLVPGNKWIHIIDTYTSVVWGDKEL